MTTTKLTKRLVDFARPAIRVRGGVSVACNAYFYDTTVRGFGLKLRPPAGASTSSNTVSEAAAGRSLADT